MIYLKIKKILFDKTSRLICVSVAFFNHIYYKMEIVDNAVNWKAQE